MKYAIATLWAATLIVCSTLSAASADGQGVSSHFWYPGDNGTLSRSDCAVKAASSLATAGFHHTSTSETANSKVVYADKGVYQAAVFCLRDNGTIVFVVMGPSQSTTSDLTKKFAAAWRAE